EDLNANVRVDVDREARKKGTPLGDALLTAGVDRDTGTSKNIIAIGAALESQVATLEEVESIWARASGDIQKLAKTDLPAANEAYRQMIEFARAHEASIGRVMQLEQQRLQINIQRKAQTGESATAEILALERVRLAQEA